MFKQDLIYTITDATQGSTSEFVKVLNTLQVGDDILLELLLLDRESEKEEFKPIGIVKYRFLKDINILLREVDNEVK